ncbi:MAG: hypothetical protein JRI25_24835 [Deltaproteobacteria bacterium]|nr:hypothetical protein [Deltaproteobacteria bacterium]MBW2257806.1 hypothetical protein [Deltaproteobacteria bacterium]
MHPSRAALALPVLIAILACGSGDRVDPNPPPRAVPPAPAPPAEPATPDPVEEPEALGPEVPYDIDNPRTIVDLFMVMPTDHLGSGMFGVEGEHRERVLRTTTEAEGPANYRPKRDTLDLPNGYLSFSLDGDGGWESAAFTYYKQDDGSRLLAYTHTTGGMCGEASDLWFYRYRDGTWTEVTDEVWSDVPWTAFATAEAAAAQTTPPSVVITLPQKGKDIAVKLGECELMDRVTEDQLHTQAITMHYLEGSFSLCTLPGSATRWAVAYCVWVMGTDDMETVIASDCFTTAEAEGTEECARRAALKERICELRVERDPATGSVEACVSDDGFIPNGVSEGF